MPDVPHVQYNLLTEPIFTVEWPDAQRATLNLPDVFSNLGADEPIEFAALQAHQTHAWHAFLVQLAAIALDHAGETSIAHDADGWRRLFRDLTEGREEPWCLIVGDLSQPAFMQPPVPEGSVDGWKNATACPDEIDLLVTGRNHDVKSRKMAYSRPEHWIYALISLQTMSGYPGRQNYGIARMNGGYGNRPCFALASSPTWTARFARDVQLVLENRPLLVRQYGYQGRGGYALLWLVPWDGTHPLAVSACDPLFIEVCRRVRLSHQDGSVFAKWTGTKDRRIDAKDRKGDLGDPWTPIRKKDGAAFGYKDVSYETVEEVVFGSDWSPSAASLPRNEDGISPWLIAQVLARAEGGTEGLYERLIPVPPKARRLFGTTEGRERLGRLSRQRIELVATVRKNVLFPALKKLTDIPRPFTRALDERVDAIFFERLFDDVDRETAEAAQDFTRRVLDIARGILREAIESLPLPAVRRYRSITAAEGLFEGTARKRFPDLYRLKGKETDDRVVAS